MAYFAPYIDNTGWHTPAYNDILQGLIDEAKNIYGADIYLEPDSMDYQLLSILAARIFDSFQTAQMVYNNRTPQTAVGTGLDAMAQMYGISRRPAVYTTVQVNLTGTANTVINNGVIADIDGNKYDLPAVVTLDSGGAASVTATAQEAGALNYSAGQVNVIVTPVAGWLTVTNPAATVAGSVIEPDAVLRARIAQSVYLPSRSILDGIQAALLAVDGVGRVKVYENDTSVTDANSIPAHSICAVVEGGAAEDIANAIYLHKTVGCGTYGSSSYTITSIYGFNSTINYTPLTATNIAVTVAVKKLAGWSNAFIDEIKANLVNFISNLGIADNVTISSLWYAAMQAQPDQYSPAYSITGITAGVQGGAQGTSDITIAYNKAAALTAADITVNVS